LILAFNWSWSEWKSRSTPLSWTSELPKSNTLGKKYFTTIFYFGIEDGGEDTMETGRPSGMSTIIKSIPPPELCTPLKA
jgi:hypothetical protein